MDKWTVLRGFLAKEHNAVKTKYLGETSTGAKAEKAQTVVSTLEMVWKAMDKIEEEEKKEATK